MWLLLTSSDTFGLTDIVNIISSGGAPAVLMLAVYAFMTDRLVTGRRHRDELNYERARADKWEAFAMRAQTQAERSTEVAGRAVDKLPLSSVKDGA